MKRNLFERIKGYLGVVMIIAAIGSIFFWENYGREKLLYENQVVFLEDVYPNTIITDALLTTLPVEKTKLISDPVINSKEVSGKETKIFIPKNAPLHKSYFDDPKVVLDKDEYIFSIPTDWIKTFPDTLRRKDTIYIYEYKEANKLNIAEVTKSDALNITDQDAIKLLENKKPIASFTVAYVKDGANREVVDSSKVERQDGTSNIQKIEVATTDEKIKTLEKSYRAGNKFILMYK